MHGTWVTGCLRALAQRISGHSHQQIILLFDDTIYIPIWGKTVQLSDRIGRRMKLQDLHVLMTVVQAGSMGKAARHLNTSQPNISKSIADLEDALGVRLLDRHRQGVEPTKYGRALLDCGVSVFDDLRQGLKNIEFLADPAAGEVRIGSTSLVAASFVSAVVERLCRRYPRIVFHLVTAEAETLHRELSERNVDLLVARRFGRIADERQGFDFLFDDSFVVVAGAQHRWARRRRIALAELANEAWVLPPPASVVGSVAMEAFRASGLDYPRVTVVTVPPEVRTSLLASGLFLTIVPASALRFPTARPELKVLPVTLPMTRVPVGIVTLKNRTLSPVAKLFIDHARDVARPLAKGK
jgi:DNA-binding transcriptional LysR family regulator